MDAEPAPVAVAQTALDASTTIAIDDRGKAPTSYTAHELDEGVPEGSEDIFPGDKGALTAWLVLLGSFLSLFPTFGLMVSIGTLQDYWSAHQLSLFSASTIGWIPSILVYIGKCDNQKRNLNSKRPCERCPNRKLIFCP